MSDKSTEKVECLFRYLRELAALKTKCVHDFKDQVWFLDPATLSDELPGVSLSYRDSYDDGPVTDDALMSVTKPEFERCPEPSEQIVVWLKKGWDLFENEAEIKEWRIATDSSTNEPIKILFSDCSELRGPMDEWLAKRQEWVKNQKKVAFVRDLFVELYNVHADLVRDGETLELMVGTGFIQDLANPETNHPLLLKAVSMSFDSAKNVMSIVDGDSSPELYSLLLRDIPDFSLDCVQDVEAELAREQYHPFDRLQTPQFLKRLVYRLTPYSEFHDRMDAEFTSPDARILLSLRPVFFVRKRIDGTAKAIDRILESIDSGGVIPSHLIDIVDGGTVEIVNRDEEETIEEKLAAVGGEDPDILLAKEANREQLEIARRIEKHHAVLVQGPPGTGKTHTIANLLGHFLAQGKSVLVTSQTRKALAVLKEKLPTGMQDLCVSVIGDSNEDMERSVDAISEFSGEHTSNELQRIVEKASEEREDVICELSKVRAKIFATLHQENETIVIDGESISPIDAAKYINEKKEQLEGLIPGEIKMGCSMPLSAKELSALYRFNGLVAVEEEAELEAGLPSQEDIILPSDYAHALEELARADEIIKRACSAREWRIQKKLGGGALVVESPNDKITISLENPEAIHSLLDYVKGYKGTEKWRVRAAADGKKGGGYRARWEKLFEEITEAQSLSQELVAESLGMNVVIADGFSVSAAHSDLLKMANILDKKGKISKLDRMLNKGIEAIEAAVKINGGPLRSSSDCLFVLKKAQLEEKRSSCRAYWKELMSDYGAPAFDDLDPHEPERIAFNWIDRIKSLLDWYGGERAKLIDLMERAGISPINSVLKESSFDSEEADVLRTLEAMETSIPLICEIADAAIVAEKSAASIEQTKSLLQGSGCADMPVCRSLSSAIDEENPDSYTKAYGDYQALNEKIALKEERDSYLRTIDDCAPGWASAIRRREGVHGFESVPVGLTDAWRYAQYVMILDNLCGTSLSELQEEAFRLSGLYRQKTTALAQNKAWLSLLEKTETNITMKQALNGWKLAMKRVGKGTGKRAAELKARAREQMAVCQQAVPAWIMPMGKALDTLDPRSNHFDVIIVDEASQSDVSSLAITFMGSKVIIVGDDKQVSPMSIGIEDAKISALNNMYIKGRIPNDYLYGPTTSLYDIAGTTFQPLMLREHFRCVPQIIGYSNMLSYDFKIKPLREPGSSKLLPAVVNHRVPGGMRDGRSKTNRAEAEEIVSLMMSCIRQPEYEGKTFGVISLLGGGNQVKLIQQIMFSRMSLKEIEARRILVGDPTSFQGDERDVIFLSLVDGNASEGPLRLLGNGADDAMKKRYNVAASRAKDQLWVVHSLDHANDLKGNDLRKTLIEYAENPEAFARRIDEVETFAESPFEEAVGKALIAKGYRIVQQWEVGSYRLDIVVIGKNGRAAIECDGELWHSGDDKIRDDMERQAILERIGWRFIRIRGSEYYRDPDDAMERVYASLTKLGIKPDSLDVSDDGEQGKSELLQRVLAGLDRGDADSRERLFGLSRAETIAAALRCQEGSVEPLIPTFEKPESSAKTEHECVADLPSGKGESIKDEPIKQASLFDQAAELYPDAERLVAMDAAIDNHVGAAQKQPAAERAREGCDQDKPKDIETAEELKDQVVLALEDKGLTTVDKRGVNGNLWVLGDFTIGDKVRNVAREFNVRFEYVNGGSRATGHQPGWYMVGKLTYRPEAKPLRYVPVKGKLPEGTVGDRAGNRVVEFEAGEKRERLVAGAVNVNVSKRAFEAAELQSRNIGDASLYTNSRYYAEIQKRMEQVIEKEAPVEKQRLFNAVRGALGVKRSGEEIQAHNEWILSKIPHKKTRFSGCDFIWSDDQHPEEYNEYRPNGENGKRKYSEIPYEEIEAAIKDSLSRTVYCGREALVERIKTAFGLKRTTDNLCEVFGKAIDEAYSRGVICKDDRDRYSLPRN